MSDSVRMRIVAFLGLVAVLIGNGIALATHDFDDGHGEDPPSELSAVVPGLEAFVEQARGLKFKRPVKVELLSAGDFTEKLREGEEDLEEEGPEDSQAFAGFLRALGLVHGPVDLDAAAQAVEEDGIAGFYDPDKKRLFVRGGELTPFVRAVLVHELTHALDDQHFDLDRPGLEERNDESAMSFRAIVEGSAVDVERQYLLRLSDAEQEAALAEEDSIGGVASTVVPEVVVRLLSYPYVVGPQLIEALKDEGGSARVDAALKQPPITSEQLLHPEKFLIGEKPATVGRPEPEGEILERGVLGEAVLYLILDEVLPGDVARRAAEGWGGDRYVAWSDAGQTCVKWNLVMDSDSDTAEALAALRQWESENPGATVQGSSTLTITNCG